MPVVGHQAVGVQRHRIPLHPFRQDLFERLVVAGLVKNPHPCVATVENVMNHAAATTWEMGYN
jgi:hypothetical protein